MDTFGKAAVRAKQLILKSAQSPEKAWESAIAEFTKSALMQTKGCPKGAFLGLCEAGVIAGIPAGRYGAPVPNPNGQYALEAWQKLQREPKLSENKKKLWDTLKAPKNENGQMDVVVWLWRDQPASTR
jgi:hypothetical protein